MKRLLLVVGKIGASAGILAYLIYQAQANQVFTDLANRPKNWSLLACALAAYVVALAITFVRWWYLVRALGIDLSLRESTRLGFLGFLFNLAPMGIVGGDLLKAVMLARQHPKHRAESLMTVFVDRVIGLYVLFLVASVAIVVTGLWRLDVTIVQIACKGVWIITTVATVAVIVPLAPDLSRGKSADLIGRIPYVGGMLKKMLLAVGLYRQKIPALCGCALATVPVHCLFVLVVYWICAAMFDPHPTLGTHFVATPVSSATAVIPINLGPFEFALDKLYVAIPLPDGEHMVPGQGLVVALGYRVITLLIAAVGLGYYLSSRREVADVLHEAEMEESADPSA